MYKPICYGNFKRWNWVSAWHYKGEISVPSGSLTGSEIRKSQSPFAHPDLIRIYHQTRDLEIPISLRPQYIRLTFNQSRLPKKFSLRLCGLKHTQHFILHLFYLTSSLCAIFFIIMTSIFYCTSLLCHQFSVCYISILKCCCNVI